MILRCCVWVLVCVSSCVWAADEEPPSRRMLGGHLFMPSKLLSIPFLTTDAGTYWQGGFGSVTDPTLNPSQKFRAADGGVGFDLQAAVLNNLSVLASVSGGIQGGGLKTGVEGFWDYAIGVRYKVFENLRWFVSTDLQLVGRGNSGLSVRSLPILIGSLPDPNFRAELNTCLNDPNDVISEAACAAALSRISTSTGSLGPRAGVSAAFGINPVIGLWWNAAYSHWFRSTTNPANFIGQAQAGMGVSIDLGQATKVPIGFLLAAQYTYLFDYITQFQRQNDVLALSAGILYTGNRHLSFGINVADEITPQQNTTSNVYVNCVTAALTLRYYWN